MSRTQSDARRAQARALSRRARNQTRNATTRATTASAAEMPPLASTRATDGAVLMEASTPAAPLVPIAATVVSPAGSGSQRRQTAKAGNVATRPTRGAPAVTSATVRATTPLDAATGATTAARLEPAPERKAQKYASEAATPERTEEAPTPPPVAARPSAASSSQKHPTLALMAEIAARGSGAGASTPPPNISVRVAGEGERTPLPGESRVAPALPLTPRTPLGAETHPMRALRPMTSATRVDAERSLEASLSGRSVSTSRGMSGARSASRAHGHLPFPAPNLVLVTAGGHAALAAIAALVGAALMLRGHTLAAAPLALAALSGCSAGLAYLLDQRRATRRTAGGVLLCAQVGMLAWLMTLIGPRAALLVLLPALAALAARMVGRGAAWLQALGSLAIFVGLTLLEIAGRYAPPLFVRGVAALALDGALAMLAALISLAALHGMARDRERALAVARARDHEARTMRERLARERTQSEADAEALRMALAAALRRRVVFPVSAEGPLSPLATTTNRTLERLAELHQDHEERARLEAALRRLARALERSWLGLPWAWPEATGTPVDEVVALLRAPRPADVPAQSWPDDAPTLISLPTLRDAREQAGALAAAVAANASTPPRRRSAHLAEVTPPETGISSSRWTLHEAEEGEDDGARERAAVGDGEREFASRDTDEHPTMER